MSSPTATVLDLDGRGGVGINDLAVWFADFGDPLQQPWGRSDFDGDGVLGVNDLSKWITAFGAGGSVTGCTRTCP